MVSHFSFDLISIIYLRSVWLVSLCNFIASRPRRPNLYICSLFLKLDVQQKSFGFGRTDIAFFFYRKVLIERKFTYTDMYNTSLYICIRKEHRVIYIYIYIYIGGALSLIAVNSTFFAYFAFGGFIFTNRGELTKKHFDVFIFIQQIIFYGS